MKTPADVICVVDANGQAVSEAFVSVEAAGAPFPEIALITDGSGMVRLNLPKGPFRIGARTAAGDYGSVGGVKGGKILRKVVITIPSPEGK